MRFFGRSRNKPTSLSSTARATLRKSRWRAWIYADKAAKDMRFGCYVNRYDNITPLVELLEQTGRVSVDVKGKTVRIFINH